MHWASFAPSFLAAFAASLVEFVEALTILLAVGIVRGWRSALIGAGAALAVLVGLVAALGPSLKQIPLHLVQLVVGTLLLLFGFRWLRKAVLRSAGVLATHDEGETYRKEIEALRLQHPGAPQSFDKTGFVAVFKSVLLEGIEVVFIIVAIGSRGGMLGAAAAGAVLALLLVGVLGLMLHRPLTSIPENALKFGVGVMLGAFGTFWVVEGIGIQWPGADWALLGLIAFFLALATALVPLCRNLAMKAGNAQEMPARPAAAAPAASQPAAAHGPFAIALDELKDLFIDDGWLAIGIVAWVAAAWLGRDEVTAAPVLLAAICFTAGLAGSLGGSALRRAAA